MKKILVSSLFVAVPFIAFASPVAVIVPAVASASSTISIQVPFSGSANSVVWGILTPYHAIVHNGSCESTSQFDVQVPAATGSYLFGYQLRSGNHCANAVGQFNTIPFSVN